MMQTAYANCVNSMKEYLNQEDPAHVVVALDGWSMFHNAYLGINLHLIDSNWNKKVINVACSPMNKSHTAENMALRLKNIMLEWNQHEKVVFILRDSASNMIRLGDMMQVKHGDCANHKLQLVVKESMLEKPNIKSVLDKVRPLSKYENRNVKVSKALVAAQAKKDDTPKHYIMDITTRWNSAYDMLERVSVLKHETNDLLGDPQWAQKLETKIYPSDWVAIEKTVATLKLFKEATLIFSKSTACIS